MIITKYKNDDITQSEEYTQYYGEDIGKLRSKQYIKNIVTDNIYRDCELRDGYRGFIIGVEDNFVYNDYYYIVWCPQNQKIYHELFNAIRIIK